MDSRILAPALIACGRLFVHFGIGGCAAYIVPRTGLLALEASHLLQPAPRPVRFDSWSNLVEVNNGIAWEIRDQLLVSREHVTAFLLSQCHK